VISQALGARQSTWSLYHGYCLLAAAGLVAFADWLFYDHDIGISVPLFLWTLAAVSALMNATRTGLVDQVKAMAILVLALLPSAVSIDPLSLSFAAAGIGVFLLVMTRQWPGLSPHLFAALLRLSIIGPVQFGIDIIRLHRIWSRRGHNLQLLRRLAVWVIPLGCGAVFLALFIGANPIMRLWFDRIDWHAMDSHPSFARVLFWAAVTCVIWPLLSVKRRGIMLGETLQEPHVLAEIGRWLTPAIILRSLLLFNLLFAVETGLDVAYLWAGVALPNGMTYAQYAHGGAYPLMVTAVLAGGFVIVALRPGRASEASLPIRALVYLWTLQNIMLVVSSIRRLDLYVAAYSLTWLRVAAFLWMGLVAIGLGLLILRIALRQRDLWLLKANVMVLLAMFYASCFVNISAVIADYNVAHCAEATGQGTPLDLGYLEMLGPQAIPALDRYIALSSQPGSWIRPADDRARMADAAMRNRGNWRAWSFRDDQLWRYLDGKAAR
jgi:hypothetical protein